MCSGDALSITRGELVWFYSSIPARSRLFYSRSHGSQYHGKLLHQRATPLGSEISTGLGDPGLDLPTETFGPSVDLGPRSGVDVGGTSLYVLTYL